MLNIKHIHKNILNISTDLNKEEPLRRRGISFPILLISIIFCFITIFNFNLEILNSNKYSIKADQLNIKEKYIQPLRGIIYDVNGNALLKNVERFDIYLKKANYSDDILKKLSVITSNALNLDLNQISVKFNSILSSKYDVKIASNLDANSAINLQIATKNDSSIYFKTGFKREYLYPNEFSHILGYTGQTQAEEIDKGYLPEDQIGKYKLELQLEDQLKGIKGKSIFINGIETKENSQPGDDVYLTINSKWQIGLYKILGNEIEANNAAGGAGVVVDDTNGNIISLVSYPGFDTNLFINGIDNIKYQAYQNNREKPLLDKAIGLQAAPGSSFKLITAYTLLENNIVDENTGFFSNRCIALGGTQFCEYHQLFYGQMNLVRALYKSSNLFFCTNTIKLFEQNKYSKFVNAASLFNIGSKTGINLIGEASGNMDSPEYRKKTVNESWYNGDTCNASIGQGGVLTTPIQMAMVAATLENHGKYFQPNIIDKITDSNGNVIQKPEPIIKREIPIQDKTLSLIEQGMHDVAHNPQGTIYSFVNDIPGNVRAKTGTAEVFEDVNGSAVYRTHGWIAGTFDYHGKPYSFAFHMNYGGGGFYIGKSLRRFVNCVYADFTNNCDQK